MSIVTLITDYGTQDHYVGALKGVILGFAPDIRIVDVTHEIEPHNVAHGAFVLRQTWPWYPPDTVHLAIVDPGVGSERRTILGRYAGQYVVAPDNGLVTFVHREMAGEALHAVENRGFFLPRTSATFHGRDIMAPVAAHLARGRAADEFGPAIDDPVLLPVEDQARSTGLSVDGKARYVDRFGTLVTNIREEQIAALVRRGGTLEVLVDGIKIGPLRSTFCEVEPGEPVALVGSAGLLEVAVNRGRAVERFGSAPTVGVVVS